LRREADNSIIRAGDFNGTLIIFEKSNLIENAMGIHALRLSLKHPCAESQVPSVAVLRWQDF
jgi:hypothetical protein